MRSARLDGKATLRRTLNRAELRWSATEAKGKIDMGATASSSRRTRTVEGAAGTREPAPCASGSGTVMFTPRLLVPPRGWTPPMRDADCWRACQSSNGAKRIEEKITCRPGEAMAAAGTLRPPLC